MTRLLLALLLAAAALPATTLAADHETHPFRVHDMLAMGRLGSLTRSPDGGWLAFTVRSTDLEANRGRTDIWVVKPDGSGLRQLTTHEASDHSPVWAPDGSQLYFLSSRGGSSQVWLMPVDLPGEARQVTDLPLDAGDLGLAPDGSTLAVTMEVYPDCPDLDRTVDRLAEAEADPTTGQAYDQLFVRHWDSWKDGRRRHLFVLPADGSGEPVDLTAGLDSDVPTRPWGGAEEYAFTPDGRGMVYVAKKTGASEPWSTDYDLYHVPVAGGEATCLTEANEAWDTLPVFSPDGKTLAYKAMAEPGYEADRFRVVLRDYADGEFGEPRVLTGGWDRSPGSLSWGPSSRDLWAHANDLGHRSLFRIDAGSGEATRVFQDGAVHAEVAGRDRVYFLRSHFGGPAEIYSIRGDGKGLRQLTDINGERVAAARMGEAEQFTFAGANGDEVYAWVVKPVDFDPAKRYPVAYLVHGGPQGSFGSSFHYRWNPQAYAGAGYAAVMVDFHGSTGYGQEFTDSINNDWGGKPLEDLKLGLAAALERYPWMDGERVSALGASYGGYMMNWIAGHWPDRFRSLVNHDGVFELRSMYFSTEELWFPEREFGGPYWANPEGYERWNPANFVDKWQTPMLVIQGALDYRVPGTQSLGAFTALQRQGIESRLLWFPDENHWVLKPQNSIQWHEEVIGWLDRFTKE